MKTIMIASNNPGKLAEYQQLLAPLGFNWQNSYDNHLPSPAETGLTFIENALLKARSISSLTQLPTLADDSGLIVPYLGNSPGVYSARYAGEQQNDADNIAKLLQNLADVPWNQRKAYFYCCIVLLRHPADPCPLLSEAFWHGYILESSEGKQGFGYDPIFFVPTHQCSAGSLPITIKNTISHRGQALTKLIPLLDQFKLI